jgi:hypothetical protein
MNTGRCTLGFYEFHDLHSSRCSKFVFEALSNESPPQIFIAITRIGLE